MTKTEAAEGLLLAALLVLVDPVRRHAILGHLVHPLGADLDLQGHRRIVVDKGHVQRLVASRNRGLST